MKRVKRTGGDAVIGTFGPMQTAGVSVASKILPGRPIGGEHVEAVGALPDARQPHHPGQFDAGMERPAETIDAARHARAGPPAPPASARWKSGGTGGAPGQSSAKLPASQRCRCAYCVGVTARSASASLGAFRTFAIGVAVDLRHLAARPDAAPAVGIAEQFEHPPTPVEIVRRTVAQPVDRRGIARVERRAVTVHDEQAVIDPLQARQAIEDRPDVVGERGGRRRCDPALRAGTSRARYRPW